MTGPVQVLVVGYDEPSFTGEAWAELTRLRQAGVVRLVDLLLVSRDADGTFRTLPPPEGAAPDLGRIAADILGQGSGGAGGDDDGEGTASSDDGSWSLADALEPGGVAAVVLIEHLWAGPLVDAIRGSGGRALAEAWLSPEDRARLPVDPG